MPVERLLVTGATGLVGSHVAEWAVSAGIPVRALVRAGTDAQWLTERGVELVAGDLSLPESLPAAVAGVTHVVHAAAKVGDWGPLDGYRAVNVRGLSICWTPSPPRRCGVLSTSARSGSMNRATITERTRPRPRPLSDSTDTPCRRSKPKTWSCAAFGKSSFPSSSSVPDSSTDRATALCYRD